MVRRVPSEALRSAFLRSRGGNAAGVSDVVVIKLGGRALEAPGADAELASAVAAASFPVVIVHGGGREVSAWSQRLGIESRFAAGLRITDASTLEVATAVLAGLANKRLVASLRAAGVDAVGLSALDGAIVDTVPHSADEGLGSVGRAVNANASLLRTLLDGGFTPVISSIGAHEGALLNLNADEIAGAVAGSLGARALLLLSDVPGVVLDGAVAPCIHTADIEALLQRPDIKDGMIPKLAAARRAVEAGAGSATIGAWSGPDSLAALVAGNAAATVVLPSPDPEHVAGATPEESHV